jgi:DNA repair protein RecO (recombination protein O)
MSLVETESLILRTYNLGDADRIVVLFTRDNGIIRGVAKGAKRLKSRFGSSLEPFSEVRVTYFQRENVELVALDKLEIVKSVFDAASDPDLLGCFSYLSELLIAFLPPHDPHEAVYRLTRACIEHAIALPESASVTIVYFELWLLRFTGYLPDWSSCSECRRELEVSEDADMQVNFQLLCSVCRRARSQHVISPKVRGLVADAMRLSPSEFTSSVKDGRGDEIGIISPIMRSIISTALGREHGISLPMTQVYR